eukprot:GFUD01004104.1.p1 GENE.GFUD01004104.1~~GFUD01004104.1.p1  ORF type:complete len:153 (+),score=56.31 GFUD01004104.1:200-658(+)
MDTRVVMSSLLGGVVGGLGSMALWCLWKHNKQSKIVRLHTADPRASSVVVHNGVVRLSGQVGVIANLGTSDLEQQVKETLVKIENLLADVGTDKSRILEARIWLKDIKTDFAAMNAIWNSWVDPNCKGVRYCVESALARETLLVEIQVVAAL